METLKHSIKIYRGEQFTIDKQLINKDGSPYIISNSLNNPHFLISVSDKPYAQPGRLIRNFWLPISSTYELVRPIRTSELEDFDGIYFDDSTSMHNAIFKNGDVYEFYYDSAIYYVDHDVNNSRYGKYVKWNLSTKDWSEYTLNVRCSFSTEETSMWKPMLYYYSIQLVTGELIREYLKNLADRYNISYEDSIPALNDFDSSAYTTNDELVELIKKKGHVFPEDFDVNQSLGFISTSIPILSPSELSVTNYMQGGIL